MCRFFCFHFETVFRNEQKINDGKGSQPFNLNVLICSSTHGLFWHKFFFSLVTNDEIMMREKHDTERKRASEWTSVRKHTRSPIDEQTTYHFQIFHWQLLANDTLEGDSERMEGENTAIADTKSYHIVTNCHTDFYVGGPLIWQSVLTHSNSTQPNSAQHSSLSLLCRIAFMTKLTHHHYSFDTHQITDQTRHISFFLACFTKWRSSS